MPIQPKTHHTGYSQGTIVHLSGSSLIKESGVTLLVIRSINNKTYSPTLRKCRWPPQFETFIALVLRQGARVQWETSIALVLAGSTNAMEVSIRGGRLYFRKVRE
ncbi:hypothetical protein Tco_0463019 [Tanacetum coccineum]